MVRLLLPVLRRSDGSETGGSRYRSTGTYPTAFRNAPVPYVTFVSRLAIRPAQGGARRGTGRRDRGRTPPRRARDARRRRRPRSTGRGRLPTPPNRLTPSGPERGPPGRSAR